MKSILVVFISLLVIIGAVAFIFKDRFFPVSQPVSQCKTSQMIFYYLDTCSACQEFKKSGTIEKLEKLGVKIQKVNAATGPIRHKFETVPTFVIGDNIYSDALSFEQLSKILGCPKLSPSPSE